jgi:hypothetical protein
MMEMAGVVNPRNTSEGCASACTHGNVGYWISGINGTLGEKSKALYKLVHVKRGGILNSLKY